jgi:hypothetical protein
MANEPEFFFQTMFDEKLILDTLLNSDKVSVYIKDVNGRLLHASQKC